MIALVILDSTIILENDPFSYRMHVVKSHPSPNENDSLSSKMILICIHVCRVCYQPTIPWFLKVRLMQLYYLVEVFIQQ